MTLSAILAAFDEAALVALANKGLVRRAARDVEEGKVTLSHADDDGAIVVADGETVRIDAPGPAKASCTCPAPGVCRHRIAAVLFLRNQPAGSLPASTPDMPLSQEIAALAEERLIRFAGRAGWRAAIEMAEQGAEIEESDHALVVRLTGQDGAIRYVRGLGIDGMVSKVPVGRRKALHVAALIAVRRAAGIVPQVEVVVKPADAVAAVDPAFLDEVRGALADACRTGLSLAPLALEERIFTLSVSSRADALPRLGGMLRRIARMLRDRRDRSAQFDPDDCLGAIAAADALARALAAVADAGRMNALMGTVRRRYDDIGPLALHGMGGEVWQADGGARGATAFLYDPADDRWFTAALARGAGQDPWFDSRRAFAGEPWCGGQPLAAVARGRLTFDNAVASPSGRLLARPGIVPSVAAGSAPDPDWACSFDRWMPLGERLRDRLAGTLAAPAPTFEPALLRPRRTGAPWFDDLTQQLFWPLQDADGQWLATTIAHDPARVAHFDHLASTALRAGFTGTVVVMGSIAGATIALRPITLFDASGMQMIDFVEPRPTKRSFADVVRAFARPVRGRLTPRARPPGATLLGDIVDELTGIAETGCRAADERRLARLAERAERSGLPTIAGLLRGVDDTPALAANLLACRHGVDRFRRHLVGLPLLNVS